MSDLNDAMKWATVGLTCEHGCHIVSKGPLYANILADEITRLRSELSKAREEIAALRRRDGIILVEGSGESNDEIEALRDLLESERKTRQKAESALEAARAESRKMEEYHANQIHALKSELRRVYDVRDEYRKNAILLREKLTMKNEAVCFNHNKSVWACKHNSCIFMRVKFYLLWGAFAGLILILFSGCVTNQKCTKLFLPPAINYSSGHDCGWTEHVPALFWIHE